MVKQELYKIFVNKTAIIFILVLLVNVAQLMYLENKANVWDAEGYNAVWEDIGSSDSDSAKVKARIDELVAEINVRWEEISRDDQDYAKRNKEPL